MSARNLLLVAVGLACLNTSTHAAWTNSTQPQSNQGNSAQPVSGGDTQASIVKKQIPTRPLPPRPTTSLPSKPETQPVVASAKQPNQSLNRDTEQFFKQFSSDLSAALNIDKCIYKSITVDKKIFKTSIIRKLKTGINNDKFKSYTEYLSRLNESYNSILFGDLKSMLSELTEHGFKSGMVVYDSQIKGMITRVIRIGSQIAPKIPSYTLLSTNETGSDMYGPYVKALPDNTLVELKNCIISNKFTTSEANKFKDEFLSKITVELAERSKNILVKKFNNKK